MIQKKQIRVHQRTHYLEQQLLHWVLDNHIWTFTYKTDEGCGSSFAFLTQNVICYSFSVTSPEQGRPFLCQLPILDQSFCTPHVVRQEGRLLHPIHALLSRKEQDRQTERWKAMIRAELRHGWMLSKPPNATHSIPTAAYTLSEFSTEADNSLAEALQGCNTKNQHRKQLQKYSSWQQGNPSSSSASSSWCSPTALEHSCLQRAGDKEQTQCQAGFSPSSTEINHFSASSKPQPP